MTKATKLAIEIRPTWSPMARLYVHVYQNGREWVPRAHSKTATQFDSQEQAQAVIVKFELDKHRATIVAA